MATYRGIADRLAAAKKLYGDAGKLVDEAEALIGGTAPVRPPGQRGRGRPPASGNRAAAGETTGAGMSGAKVALSELPGIIARRYPQTGATADEVIAIMGWKAGTPMSNLGRLVREGTLAKAGDRYRATLPTERQQEQAA